MSAKKMTVAGLIGALAVMALVLGLSTQHADPAVAIEPGTGLPLEPRTDTPQVIGGTVRDQTVVGDLVIVVGTFEQVRDNDGTLLEQRFIVAYDIDSGAIAREYSPVFDRQINAVEPDGLGGVVVGGAFNSIDGEVQRKLARLDAQGERVPAFQAETGAKVTDVAVRNDRVYVGGPFSAVRSQGSWASRKRLAVFELSDGALDRAFNIAITESAGRGGDLSVKALGFAGDDLVVAHSGRVVDGESRVGAAIIRTTPVDSPQLLDWRTDFYKRTTTDAGNNLAITNMAVSPDGSYFVIVSAGGDAPHEGRDSALRFETSPDSDGEPTWISRHFDSLFGVGISDQAVFIGGHFQYQEAPGSPDPYPGDPELNYGAGAFGQGAAILGNQVAARQQIGALDPTTGKTLNWNPGATADIGVESLVVVERGLLVGQDGDMLGGQTIGRHGFFDITHDPAPDFGLSTTIESHFNGQNVDAGPITLSGQATDEVGVDRVQVTIYDPSSKQYVQPDGSLGSWIALPASLETPNAQQTTWTAAVEIDEPASYRVKAKTFTTDGRKDQTSGLLDLVVRPAEDDRPNISMNTPAITDVRTISITGSASDDRGVRSVGVAVRDSETNDYLQADGTLAPGTHRFDATLAAVDSPETSWTLTALVPSDGKFNLEANVYDTAGQDDAKYVYKTITVATNDLAPTVDLDGETTLEILANEPVTISPVVTEDVELDYVRVRIQRQLTLEGTRRDGTYGPYGTWVDIGGIDGQEATTATWSSPALPAGMYTMQILAVDHLGQQAKITRKIKAGLPGDDAPKIALDWDSLTINESPGLLEITGVASDNSAVDLVEVYVRDHERSRWVTPDGNRVGEPTPHVATLANPGTGSSPFDFAWPADQEGRYTLHVFAYDEHGQSSISRWRSMSNHWFTPNDALPTIGRLTPTDDAVVNNTRIVVGGRAIDDNEISKFVLRVRRESDKKFLGTDGSFGASHWFTPDLSNPGRDATNWDWSSDPLEPGLYRIDFKVLDDSGRLVSESTYVTLAPEAD